MLRDRLRLWFSFDIPVDRRTYLTNGVALMAVKYAVDAAAIWLLARKVWTPLDYFNPLLTVRLEVLRGAPSGSAPRSSSSPSRSSGSG